MFPTRITHNMLGPLLSVLVPSSPPYILHRDFLVWKVLLLPHPTLLLHRTFLFHVKYTRKKGHIRPFTTRNFNNSPMVKKKLWKGPMV